MNIIKLLKSRLFYFNKSDINESEIFYVAGSQTLPPPLEPKEEEKLIHELMKTDNLQAKQTLVERNLRLVVYIAKKFENTGVGIEDLVL